MLKFYKNLVIISSIITLLSCTTSPTQTEESIPVDDGLYKTERTLSVTERVASAWSSPLGKILLGAGALAVVVALMKSGGGDNDTPSGMLKGGLWFHIGNLAGNFVGNNESRVPDNMVVHWLDATKNTGLNMSYLVVAGYPVKDDGQLDENQMRAIDIFIQRSRSRNLSVVLQVGSYWGRRGNTWAEGRNQFLNWWGKDPRVENYLAQMSKRFGNKVALFAFNEMDKGGLGGQWKQIAPHYYNIIRQHSNVKIGVSEQNAVAGPEDFTLIHNQNRFGDTRGKPWIMDEPAGGDDLYKDNSIRNPARFNEYKEYFIKAKNHGARGIVAASWINRKVPMNDAVRRVFQELAKL